MPYVRQNTQADYREERGVVRDRMAPAGYAGYVAIAEDGTPVAFLKHLIPMDTEARRARVVEQLWIEIEEYEAAKARSTPSLPIVGPFDGPRLVSD